jgi:hypothetical protein
MVGAIAGGLARGVVVAFHVGVSSLWLAFPSAGIGALVGAIAGATGRPGKGAIVGATLSALIFGLVIMTASRLLDLVGTAVGEAGAGGPFLAWSLPYFLQMAVAGAIGGSIGGAAGKTVADRRAKAGVGPQPLG